MTRSSAGSTSRLVGRHLGPWLWLVALGVALHAPQIAGGRPYWRDTSLFFVPAKHYLAELLRRGELPAWWPWDGGGAPLLARPLFSVFHPTTLLYVVLPFWWAFTAQELWGTLTCLTGGYVLGRVLGMGRLPAVVIGTVYGLGGYLVGVVEFTQTKLSAGTLPWYLAALLWAARGPRWRWSIPSLVMGLLLVGGDPLVALLAAGAGVLWVAVVHRGRVAIGLACLSPILGGLLAAPQWLTAALCAIDSDRAHPLADIDRWPLGLDDLVNLAVPLARANGPYVPSTLIGPAALALVFAAGADPRRRLDKAVLGILSMASLLLAAGPAFPVNAWLRDLVPLWRSFRYPIKTSVLAFLTLPLLAGFGLQALHRIRVRRTAGVVLAVVGIGALLLPAARTVETFSLWAMSAGAVALLAQPRRRFRLAGTAIIGVTLLVEALPVRPLTDDAFYAASPIVTDLQRAGVSLEGGAYGRALTRTPADAVEAYWYFAAAGGLSGSTYGSLFGLPELAIYTAGGSWRVWRLFQRRWTAAQIVRLGKLFGISARVLDVPASPFPADRLFASDPAHGLTLWTIPDVLPRAYATRRAIPARDVEEAYDLVGRDALAPGHDVILEGPTEAEWALRPEAAPVPVPVTPGRRNDEVDLHADLPWDGFVVLNEATWSGWTVTVDGETRPLLTANGLARAVQVPSGHHHIHFAFHTPGLTVATALGLLTLALLIGWMGLQRPRRIQAGPPLSPPAASPRSG